MSTVSNEEMLRYSNSKRKLLTFNIENRPSSDENITPVLKKTSISDALYSTSFADHVLLFKSKTLTETHRRLQILAGFWKRIKDILQSNFL